MAAAAVLVGGVGYWLGIQRSAVADSAVGADKDAVESVGSAPEGVPATPEGVPAAEQPPHPVTAAGGGNRSNALAAESSPYLQLHAHNPVDWYPWGREALELARSQDKPIFLSVGYSTCYWCHVMEREVFSDPEIAALMNRWFVNIKVDREERPDLDQIYMLATQLVSGSGGWPNSVFMTPELKPFFAGTYFPPDDAHGRPGFPRVLETLNRFWIDRRADVEMQAEQLTQAIRRYEAASQAPPMAPDSVLVNRALAGIVGRYDARNGGFGGAPKFPPCIRLDFLLTAWERSSTRAARDSTTLAVVEHTLAQMAHGGLFDQVGGGFHRYATDAEWRVPHFEKMLYNQAHLARLYLRAYQLTGESDWRWVAEEVLGYVQREMTGPDGGFYSALDAETEAVEGKYYLWSEDSINDALGADAELFLEVYGLAPMPDGEGDVLFMPRPLSEVAADLDMEPAALRARVDRSRERLLGERGHRVYPLLDDKVLAAWNGMMIGTFAYAFEVTGAEVYRRVAERAAGFVMSRMRTADGGLGRSYRNGVLKPEGYLEDYASMASALLSLYRATGEEAWLRDGRQLVDQLIARFKDRDGAGFFYTEHGTDLIVRIKNAQDSALPSANAVVVHVLLALGKLTGEQAYVQLAGQTLNAFGSMAHANPGAFTHMIAAARKFLERDQIATAAAAAPAPSSLPRMDLYGLGGGGAARVADPLVRSRVVLESGRLVPGSDFSAAVHLNISDGWHINANPASSEFLIPTSLTVNADLPIEVLGVDYPGARPHYLESQGDTLAVYEEEITLQARLHLKPETAEGANGQLRLLIQYQACDAVRCLPPAEITKVVMLEVGSPAH